MSDQPIEKPDSRPPAPGRSGAVGRTWRVGTLCYSAGGLAMLSLWLLLGDFGYMLRERSAAPVAQLMLKNHQASDFVTGVFLLTIPWAVILLVGPTVSYWSDRCRSRWGRRIPFLLVPTPFVALSMFGLALSPQLGAWVHQAWGGGPESLNKTIVAVMGFFWTIFEIGVVVSNSVFNGLINDVVPRELLGRFYGMFRAVGLAVGVWFNYRVIGHAEEEYALILGGVGLAYGIGFTLMCMMVKEGEYPVPEPPSGKYRLTTALRDYWRDCFRSPYYLVVFLFLALGNLAFVPVNTFGLFAAKNYAMSMETYGRYLVVTYICSFCLAFPLGWLADKFHPLRVGLVALAVYCVSMVVGFATMRDPASFGWSFLAHGVLSGSFFTGISSLPQRLLPRAKFAQFAAAAGFVAALFNMLLGPLLGAALDRLGNTYSYAFLIGAGIALVALIFGLMLYVRWRKEGDGVTPAPVS